MEKQKRNYTNIKLNPLPERELEIIGEITAEKMALVREKAIKKFQEEMEIDGFRKGKAPEILVIQKVGEMRIMEEAAEIALSEEYPEILNDHHIDAIGRPDITITKLAPENPLEFKMKTYLMPEVKLSDYSGVAKKQNSKETREIEVSDKEIDDVLLEVRKNIAHQKLHTEGGLSDEDHNHEEIKDEDLPALDDEIAKMLGAKDLPELKNRIKENISKDKELKEKDKKRTSMMEEIMSSSQIDIPKIIVDGELDKMLAQFKDDIARAGMTYEDYLKHIKKTEDDLKKEWKDVAVKRAKSQIILNEIAKKEKIAPKEEDVKKEMEHILSHIKDADRFRVRMYVETFMTNELVFQFLENQNNG